MLSFYNLEAPSTKSKKRQKMVESFCIVTTRPNELCATVHDRMPLIPREEDFAAWLDVGTNQRAVDALLKPYGAAERWNATR